MITRSVPSRAVAALAALWLVLATGQAALHHCPVHDAPGPAQTTTDEHAGHHGQPAESPASDHDCACLGQCCPAAALSAPALGARVYTVAPPVVTLAVSPTPTVAPTFLAFLVLSRTGPPLLSA